MKRAASLCFSLILILVMLPSFAVSVTAANTATVYLAGTMDYDKAFEVLTLVNKERTAAGLGTLKMDAQLLPAAMQRAVECQVCFGHTRPNGSSGLSILSDYGGPRSATGENVAMGQQTALEVMSGWMNSDAHRTNILNASYTYIGVGCFYQPNGRIAWVQCFSNGTHSSVSKSGTAQTVAAVSADSDHIGTLSLHLSPESLVVGKTNAASVSVVNAGWDYASFYPTQESVVYTTSNSSIASVSSAGMVTVVGAGTVAITAKLKNFPQKSASLTLSARDERVVDWTGLESEHNYSSNTDEWWVYTAPGANVSALNIRFDDRTKVEASYDYIYIYDGADRLIGTYTGVGLAGKRLRIPGKTVKIRLTSDEYTTHWGFRVSALSEEHFTLSDALTLYRFAAGELTLTEEQRFVFAGSSAGTLGFQEALTLYRMVSGRMTA